jgi:hypothetical protein
MAQRPFLKAGRGVLPDDPDLQAAITKPLPILSGRVLTEISTIAQKDEGSSTALLSDAPTVWSPGEREAQSGCARLLRRAGTEYGTEREAAFSSESAESEESQNDKNDYDEADDVHDPVHEFTPG